MKKLAIFIAIAIALSLGILIAFNSCGGKDDCKDAVGLSKYKKPSERDSAFYKESKSMASRFNVYVESSASMDAYVRSSIDSVGKGFTQFRTSLYRIIGQVNTDVNDNDTCISLNYINSDIKKQPGTPKQFTNNMSPDAFRNSGAGRINTDLPEIISTVVKNTKPGEVSMFVSDCVFSPASGADVSKALGMQRTDILNCLKNKAKTDQNFGVLLYRFMSDFHGIYYNKTNQEIEVDGKRPYFVWFFGDRALLAKVAESISGIVSENKADYLVGIPGYEYTPFSTVGSKHEFHYTKAKTDNNCKFTGHFLADLHSLPVSKEYILDKNNYVCGDDSYSIDKIEEYSSKDPKNKSYNYKFTFSVKKGKKKSEIAPTLVTISMKPMLNRTPGWVTKYDDPEGEDYDNGYKSSKLRTFGLKSLVDGITDFYNPEQYYTTFKIKIN